MVGQQVVAQGSASVDETPTNVVLWSKQHEQFEFQPWADLPKPDGTQLALTYQLPWVSASHCGLSWDRVSGERNNCFWFSLERALAARGRQVDPEALKAE
eukprot:2920842-Amphidinium_carterae.2